MASPSDHIGTAAVIGAAAAATVGAWRMADNKLGLSLDVQLMLRDRKYLKDVMAQTASREGRASMFHMLQDCNPDADALWFEGRTYTYRDVIQESTRIACFLQARGIRQRDVVAIFMGNVPDMVFSFYAASQIGAIPALMNTALRTNTLAHSIGLVQPKLALTTPDLMVHFCAATAEIQVASLNLGSFTTNKTATAEKLGVTSLNALTILQYRGRPDPVTSKLSDVGALMFTSGTTGHPKAVAVKNFSFAAIATELPEETVQAKHEGSQSRTFCALPLFHGTGLFGALNWSLSCSGCACIARKFSASDFSRQLVESRATRMTYVGEICRYMLAAPPSEFDRAHNVKIAWGNGMQKDVWLKFQERFGVTYIREFYRATEGLASFQNFANVPGGEGCIGFKGFLSRMLERDTFLIRIDEETGELLRHPKTGFCVVAGPGETGEAIGRLPSLAMLNSYLNDKEATEAKLVRNVFAKGDLFQRTGDLITHDASGWIRFADRLGDTFRWEGENVSAGEVRAHILEIPEVEDATVYGTRLAGYDGQVGCAAIALKDKSAKEATEVMAMLVMCLVEQGVAKYALPRLVRIVDAIPIGTTFKHLKAGLKAESWDPSKAPSEQRLYWLKGLEYCPLDSSSWAAIEQRKARL